MTYPQYWGFKPPSIPLELTRGADYIEQIEFDPSDPLPAGSTVKIVFVQAANPNQQITTWNAVVSPTMAEFAIDQALVNALPDRGVRYYMYVSYPDSPTTELPISFGSVTKN